MPTEPWPGPDKPPAELTWREFTTRFIGGVVRAIVAPCSPTEVLL